MEQKKTTGKWSARRDRYTYFASVSANDSTVKAVEALIGAKLDLLVAYQRCLVGATKGRWWETEITLPTVKRVVSQSEGRKLLVDSGVYSFATWAAARQGVETWEAFYTPEVVAGADGLEAYEQNYLRFLVEVRRVIWGAVEIDLGTFKQRRERRERFESEGIVVIPVFRPWFDGLAEASWLVRSYDRVAVPVSSASGSAYWPRWSMVKTLCDLADRHGSFVHVLGSSPIPELYACKFGSSDSSAFKAGPRYGKRQTMTANSGFVNLRSNVIRGDYYARPAFTANGSGREQLDATTEAAISMLDFALFSRQMKATIQENEDEA